MVRNLLMVVHINTLPEQLNESALCNDTSNSNQLTHSFSALFPLYHWIFFRALFFILSDISFFILQLHRLNQNHVCSISFFFFFFFLFISSFSVSFFLATKSCCNSCCFFFSLCRSNKSKKNSYLWRLVVLGGRYTIVKSDQHFYQKWFQCLN